MKRGHGTKFSHKAERFRAALLTNPSVRLAAAEAGISERTARRYLADRDFAAAHAADRLELVVQAKGILQTHTAIAAKRLVLNTQSDDAHASNRAIEILFRLADDPEIKALRAGLDELKKAVAELAAPHESAGRRMRVYK